MLDILTIALVASICGAEICVGFAESAEDLEPLLREFLSLETGLPSHDTFGRMFRLLDAAAFGRAFPAFLDDPGAGAPGSWRSTARRCAAFGRALGAARSRPKLGITSKRKRSGWSDHFARTIIGQMR